MLLGAGIGGRGEDILDAQRLKVRDGDRTPVHSVLRGNTGITQSLSAFHDVACEAPVLHQVDSVGAVGSEMGAQPSTCGVQGNACIRVEDGGAGPTVTNGDLDQFVWAVGLEPKFAIEPACQAGVHLQEFVDLPFVPRSDEAEIKAVNLKRHEKLVLSLIHI